MKWALIFFAIGAVGWIVAFFGYIKPKWLLFRQAMGIATQAKAATPAVAALMGVAAPKPTIWQRVDLRIRGLKGTILAFFSWLILSSTQLLDAIDPSVLAPVKDSELWQSVGGQTFAIRVVGVLTFLIALLSIRGQWHAARVVPAPPPPPPMSP